MPRELAFWDDLGRLLDLERNEERKRLSEERARLSLQEREARGHTAAHLEVREESIGLGGRFLYWLERADRTLLKAPFYPGTQVELFPQRPGASSGVFAVIAKASAKGVQLALERPPPPDFFDGKVLFDLVANDATYQRQRAALARFKAQDRGQERDRREVLLGNAPARLDRTRAFNPSCPLNPEQQEAVGRALSARDFFLVHGPPGTGKSHVLAEIAVQSAAAGQRILATAASNAAVDHLLELCLERGLRCVRVGHPARVLPHLQEHTLDVVVETHPDREVALDLFDEAFALQGYARKQKSQGRSRERFANARSSTAEARSLIQEARTLEAKAVRAVLDRAQVVCATLASLDGRVLEKEAFDLALVDEATQAVEPLTLIAFLKAPRVVLAGDHRQLPPTVLSTEAATKGLGVSLFERLLSDHGDAAKHMLLEQHRMHDTIMAFPSAELYDSKLRAHPSVASHSLKDLLNAPTLDVPPLLFLDTAGKGFDEEQEEGSGSFRNPGEADVVAQRVQALLAAGLSPRDMAVIAPYSAQVWALRERLVVDGLEIDTVDAFQGREKEAVLVSLTRSNADGALGFLTEIRRMNVALTRARRHLFVVGDSATLAAHPFYQRLVEYAQTHTGYRSIWEWV